MTPREIAKFRLQNQRIALSAFKEPVEVVSHLGAMQAQDYLGALWAVGLRLPDSTESAIEQAIADGKIVRTWPHRGTLHFVAAEDVRWMLALSGSRTLTDSAGRRRQLELDDPVLRKSEVLIVKALLGDRRLTRQALFQHLEDSGIPMNGQRGRHILHWLALKAVICFGPREGKQPTFVLLDEWIPKSRERGRDEALAELARRYFTGHGPAGLKDFVWWSGLKVTDARAAIDFASSGLARETVEGEEYWMPKDLTAVDEPSPVVHLLPGFDEYLLGYKNRSAVLDAKDAQKIAPGGNGMFLPTVVIDGHVTGSWKRILRKKKTEMLILPFDPLKKSEIRAVAEAAEGYERYIGSPVELVWNG